jgi:hypothetical protein
VLLFPDRMTVLTRRETSVLLNFTSLWTGRLVA